MPPTRSRRLAAAAAVALLGWAGAACGNTAEGVLDDTQDNLDAVESEVDGG